MLGIMPEIFKSLGIISIKDCIKIVWFLAPGNRSITITHIIGAQHIIDQIIDINQNFIIWIKSTVRILSQDFVISFICIKSIFGLFPETLVGIQVAVGSFYFIKLKILANINLNNIIIIS